MRSNKEIANLIVDLRKNKNISLSELARRVNMGKSTLSRYENLTREFPLNEIEKFARALGVSPEYILGIDIANISPVSKTIPIPILGTIACGEPITAEENIEGYKERTVDDLPSGELFYLNAKGDSMWPTISDGSLVLCKQQPDVESGEIAAVLVNDDTEATLKRVRKVSDMIILEPINDDYDPYIINEKNPARIVGKALEVVSKL